ncbi:uncharacterized protein B0I36DRAFT_164223 [Microdochium trichocladiopsis]|uniref:Uncharacterized protein n=1 Tax=Microdochium trichocladiopsis TaxID=1682393 RepID=A0A9P9BLT3_9PEZI|nr:uncharacterized protein B0I36DRAFT_164223 [Microdochium trichocladiopsis]KAH7024745.1 hypothetical protein B0I36DRAFT_164223 [Microdochium trichocladiopsis]
MRPCCRRGGSSVQRDKRSVTETDEDADLSGQAAASPGEKCRLAWVRRVRERQAGQRSPDLRRPRQHIRKISNACESGRPRSSGSCKRAAVVASRVLVSGPRGWAVPVARDAHDGRVSMAWTLVSRAGRQPTRATTLDHLVTGQTQACRHPSKLSQRFPAVFSV